MRHRSYRGRMIYFTDGVGEMGREHFSVTIQPDGQRTLRAQCEMDDDRLLRDVVLTVDAHWRPIDGFVRLVVEEQLVGSSWFDFGSHHAECQGRTARSGRITQQLATEAAIESFGTHALHGDAWIVGRLRQWQGAAEDFPLATFATSTLANGGSGPELIRLGKAYSKVLDLGSERITVAAGSFDTRHIRVLVPGVDDFDVWAGGEDCLPVKLTSDILKQTYELVEIDGEWR
jgi:hypothetical protein